MILSPWTCSKCRWLPEPSLYCLCTIFYVHFLNPPPPFPILFFFTLSTFSFPQVPSQMIAFSLIWFVGVKQFYPYPSPFNHISYTLLYLWCSIPSKVLFKAETFRDFETAVPRRHITQEVKRYHLCVPKDIYISGYAKLRQLDMTGFLLCWIHCS